MSQGNDTPSPERHFNPVFDARLTHLVNPQLAIGGRVRAARDTFRYDDPASLEFDQFTLYSVDLGIVAELEVGRYVTIMPWLGVHLAAGQAARSHDGMRFDEDLSPDPLVTGGLWVGGHVITEPRYRVTVYGEGQTSTTGRLADAYSMRSYTYRAVTFGASVRF